MTIKVGVVMDPIADIKYKKDSTLAMLWAVQAQDWELYYMQQEDLLLRDGKAFGNMAPLQAFEDEQNWYQIGPAQEQALSELDVILMRKDPPFDMEFIYSTYILEKAEQDGVLVVNKPSSIRDCNEKLFATEFPQCCPQGIVTRQPKALSAFHQEHGDVIFKPLDGMGGASIFRLKADDPNVSVIIETLTEHGKRQIMAQKYIPEIVQGDKRILLIDGEPVPYALARIPADGETRGNLAAGGRGEARPLTDRDRWIAQQVGPTLKQKGLLFVGIDVIGDYLTEINVTCPTCIRELNNAHDLDIAGDLMRCIKTKLNA